MEANTVEELYYKSGHKGSPFEEQKALFRFLNILKAECFFLFLDILKHNPGLDNTQGQTHGDKCHRIVWEELWVCLNLFLQHVNELNFEERSTKHDHTTLSLCLVILIGECFIVCSTSGTINNVLFQPKYEDGVYILLLFD